MNALFVRTVDAGAKPIEPVPDMFYDGRMAMVEDPFDHIWVFLMHQEDLTSAEIKQRGETLLRG